MADLFVRRRPAEGDLERLRPVLRRRFLGPPGARPGPIDSEDETQQVVLFFRFGVGPGILDLNKRFLKEQVESLLDMAAELHGSTVQRLSLEENLIADVGISALASSLKYSKLESLNLAYNRITDLAALAFGLKGASLQHLSLAHNRLSDAGAQALATGLKVSCLVTLSLEGNFIGDEGTRALAENMTNLERLNLADNCIGDSGACFLSTGVRSSGLWNLMLARNRIGRDGICELAAALKESALSVLDLSENLRGMNEEALLEGVRGWDGTSLRLCGNGISRSSLKEIGRILKTNKARCFILQTEVQGDGAERRLTFRTVGGTTAAVLSLNTFLLPMELPGVVWSAVRKSNFQLPSKAITVANLRLVLPSGAVLDPFAPLRCLSSSGLLPSPGQGMALVDGL